MPQRLSTLRAMYLLSVALTLLHGGASAIALPKTQTVAAGEIAMIGSFLSDGRGRVGAADGYRFWSEKTVLSSGQSS